MYELKNESVDLNLEADHVVRFLNQHWDLPGVDVAALVRDALTRTQHDARAWFDFYDVGAALSAKEDARRQSLRLQLPAPAGDVSDGYDALARLLSRMDTASRLLKKAGQNIDGQWDFGKRSKSLYWSLMDNHAAIENARPKGWEVLLAKDDNDCETATLDEQRRLLEDFAGADTAGPGSASFPVRVSPAWVRYDKDEQGRRPAHTLIGAIYGHFLRLVEHNNTAELCRHIDSLDVTQPLSFDVESAVRQFPEPLPPLLTCLIASAAAETDSPDLKTQMDQAVAMRIAYDALSPDEQRKMAEVTSKSNEDVISRILAELKSEGASHDDKEVQVHTTRLHEAFRVADELADAPAKLTRPRG